MTYSELYAQISAQLASAGCEDAAFDAGCIVCDIGGLPRGIAPALVDDTVSPEAQDAVYAAGAQRAAGRPLQYILGNWDFLMLNLYVGEGVLVPRPDTELLCETAAAYARRMGWDVCKALDLCSGTGCVGLGTAALLDGAVSVSVTAVEFSPEAEVYLHRNLEKYAQYPTRAVHADVLLGPPSDFVQGEYHLLLSNPPYIPSEDLPSLQREVLREPRIALDGGDGYVFYRAIAQKWLSCLCKGGLCAVEVGVGQADTVAELFAAAGLHDVHALKDLGGIDRVVCGVK